MNEVGYYYLKNVDANYIFSLQTGLKTNLILSKLFRLTCKAQLGSWVSNMAELFFLFSKINNPQSPAAWLMPGAGQVQFRNRESCSQATIVSDAHQSQFSLLSCYHFCFHGNGHQLN